jgi:kynurenine formamidase
MPMPALFHELASRVNNWGRFGADDERGTLNFLTPDTARVAAALVRDGRALTLGLPLHLDGPQTGAIPGRVNPIRTMLAINQPLTGDPTQFCTSDDIVTMGLQAGTHWDALAHASYDNRLYNGHRADSISAAGAASCGIDKTGPIVGRGVLLDVARAKGLGRLPGGYAIVPEDLEAAEELGKVRVGRGDIVLVRTGQMQLLDAGDKVGYGVPSPGPSLATVPWFFEREVAAVATDNLTFEVFPSEHPDLLLPVHLLHLVEMGLTQGQNFDLEHLAEDCASDGRYAFFLDATPQPFVGGLGTPVNPLVLK